MGRSIEELAAQRAALTPDPVSARLRGVHPDEEILTFRVSADDAAMIERVVEAESGGTLDRGTALAQIVSEHEKRQRPKAKRSR